MSPATTPIELRTEYVGTLRMTRAQLNDLISRDPATAVGEPGTGVQVQSLVRSGPGGPVWMPVELHFIAGAEIRAITEPQA